MLDALNADKKPGEKTKVLSVHMLKGGNKMEEDYLTKGRKHKRVKIDSKHLGKNMSLTEALTKRQKVAEPRKEDKAEEKRAEDKAEGERVEDKGKGEADAPMEEAGFPPCPHCGLGHTIWDCIMAADNGTMEVCPFCAGKEVEKPHRIDGCDEWRKINSDLNKKVHLLIDTRTNKPRWATVWQSWEMLVDEAKGKAPLPSLFPWSDEFAKQWLGNPENKWHIDQYHETLQLQYLPSDPERVNVDMCCAEGKKIRAEKLRKSKEMIAYGAAAKAKVAKEKAEKKKAEEERQSEEKRAQAGSSNKPDETMADAETPAQPQVIETPAVKGPKVKQTRAEKIAAMQKAHEESGEEIYYNDDELLVVSDPDTEDEVAHEADI